MRDLTTIISIILRQDDKSMAISLYWEFWWYMKRWRFRLYSGGRKKYSFSWELKLFYQISLSLSLSLSLSIRNFLKWNWTRIKYNHHHHLTLSFINSKGLTFTNMNFSSSFMMILYLSDSLFFFGLKFLKKFFLLFFNEG